MATILVAETPPLIFIPPRLGSTTSSTPGSPRLYPSQHTWRKYGQLDRSWPPRDGKSGTGWQGELSRYPYLLLLGEVGSGKTALLRYLQLHGMPDEGGGLQVRPCLYLSLSRGAVPPPVGQLASLLAGEGYSQEQVRDLLESGEARILIDNLDAVGAPGISWLEEVQRWYPRSQCLVTARRELSPFLPGFEVLRLLPWSGGMVEQWIALQGIARRAVRRSALMEAIRTVPDLPLTPLLVWLLAELVQRGLEFPRQCLEVYDSYARLLLSRCSCQGGIGALLEVDLSLALFGSLALRADGAGKLKRHIAIELIAARMAQVGLKAQAAEEVLDEIGVGSGLLAPVDDEEVIFTSLGLKSYLGARERTHHPEGIAQPPAIRGHWPGIARENLLCASMAADAGPLIKALLRGKDDIFHHRLFEAARRIGAARYVPVEDRQQVRGRLLRLFWQGPYEQQQQQALSGLCWMADREIAGHFVKALGSPIVFIRARAAEALARVRWGETAPDLQKALGDPAWRVRMYAAEGLGRIGDAGNWPVLAASLGDPHWQVRIAAADALGWLGAGEAAPQVHRALVAGYPSSQYHAVAVFRRLGLVSEAEYPMKAAEDQDLALRIRLAEALLRLGTEVAFEMLYEVLDGQDGRARLAVASVLAKEGAGAAMEVLKKGYEADDAGLRYRAALGTSFAPFICSIDYLADERQRLQLLAGFLEALLRDQAWKVRGVAAIALGSMGQSSMGPAIAALLEDPDHFVSTNAAVALGMAGCREAAGALLAVLGDEDRAETTRALAGRALGTLGVHTALGPLGQALSAGGVLLRMNAAQALGNLGEAAQLDPLLHSAAEDEEPLVRNAAFEAARRICERGEIELTQNSLNSVASFRRRAVMDAVTLLQRYY